MLIGGTMLPKDETGLEEGKMAEDLVQGCKHKGERGSPQDLS